jgi:tRNA A-37 threonylcarbamoyl transferase component Bud32
VVSNPEVGVAALRSYKLARPHTKHTNLARIYSTAVDWQPDAALALLEWVEGTPLRDYTGVLELYAEELGETDVEALLLTWIGDLCGALSKFHEIGLVHGDVSPGNVIVEGSAVTFRWHDPRWSPLG